MQNPRHETFKLIYLIKAILVLAPFIILLNIKTKKSEVPVFTWSKPVQIGEDMTFGGCYRVRDGVRYEEWHNLYKSWVTRCAYENPKDISHYEMYLDKLVHSRRITWEQADKIAKEEWANRPKTVKCDGKCPRYSLTI